MDENFGLLNEKEQAFVDAYTEKVRKQEREHILKLWEAEMNCSCEEPMQHLAKLIKEEN